jgi:hypothetical protein
MSTPSVSELKQIITKIQNIITNLDRKGIVGINAREDYFWKNHLNLMNRYPFLISQLCSNNDMTMVNKMLEQLTEIQNGEKTQHQADKDIGDVLAKEYLPK